MNYRGIYKKTGWSFNLVPSAGTYCRYYIRVGAVTKFNRGFRTRADVDDWIEGFGDLLVEQDPEILRIKLKNDIHSIYIVRKNGQVYLR